MMGGDAGRVKPMFDLDGFVEACRGFAGDDPHTPKRVLELMRGAVSDPAAVKQAVTPLAPKVGVLDAPIFRSPELTVLNVALRPGMLSIPHDHRMWAVIGIYEGEEANTFFRRTEAGLEESNHRTVKTGEAMLLGADVVHAIENALDRPTLGLHVYGGDLLGAARSMWSPHDGSEHSYDIPQFYRWSRDKAEQRRAALAQVAGG
jgi:predicted metal-dependent enzyme (double-stranded beta helix superfamily)